MELSRLEGFHLGNVYSDFTENQTNIAPKTLSALGIKNPIPCQRYETACASGSVAFRQGYLNILSGAYDLLLVGGTERLRAVPGSVTQQAMATSMDITERNAGLTFAAYWAYVAKAYARKHHLSEEKLQELLAQISVKNHYHGAFNPKAHYQKEVTLEEVLKSAMVAPPIKLMDCCPFSDGAAALILASEELARNYPQAIWIAGSGQASGPFTISDCADLSVGPAIARAAADAYRQAGVGPKEVEVAEVHDCVNIHEVVCLEGAGLAKEGEGIYAAADRRTYFDGDLPTNLSGGLKSRGHPVGATGAYQLCEMTRHLRGDFGGKKVKRAEVGLTVNVGGTGTVATVHILRKG
jgi:acetyl-CoA acetyltransferase